MPGSCRRLLLPCRSNGQRALPVGLCSLSLLWRELLLLALRLVLLLLNRLLLRELQLSHSLGSHRAAAALQRR